MSLPAPSSVSDREGPRRAVQARPPLPGGPARNPTPAPPRPVELPPAHAVLICVALPALAISTDQGQLTGQGLEGFYRAGRRTAVPLPGAGGGARTGRRAGPHAVGRPRPLRGDAATVRPTAVPDPDVIVERTRHADGTERITLHSAAAPTPATARRDRRSARTWPTLGAVASGRAGPELPASVHDSGMRWSCATGHCVVTADPRARRRHWPPRACCAGSWICRPAAPGAWSCGCGRRSAGRCGRWGTGRSSSARRGAGGRATTRGSSRSCGPIRARISRRCCCATPSTRPTCTSAAGAPWRCGLAPAEALAAARMALPLGTRIAAGTLRTLARSQLTGPGHRSGHDPGAVAGRGPPSAARVARAPRRRCSFRCCWRRPGVGGCPHRRRRSCCRRPSAVCGGYGRGRRRRVPSTLPGPPGTGQAVSPPRRPGSGGFPEPELARRDRARRGPGACAPGGTARRRSARRARRPGGAASCASGRRGCGPRSGRSSGWRTGPVADRRPPVLPDGRPVPHLTGARRPPPRHRPARRRASSPPDCSTRCRPSNSPGCSAARPWTPAGGCAAWARRRPAYNPFGHRGGAVRVQETAVAVAGLAAAGYEKEASSLLRGVLAAAEAFGHRLPEMYAGEQRTDGGAPAPAPGGLSPGGHRRGRRGAAARPRSRASAPTPRPGPSRCARCAARPSGRSA